MRAALVVLAEVYQRDFSDLTFGEAIGMTVAFVLGIVVIGGLILVFGTLGEKIQGRWHARRHFRWLGH